jgi:hypothetical protein
MSNKSRQRPLGIRVEYEPNRFSGDCLEKIYEQLHPTESRKVTPDKNNKGSDVEPKKSVGWQQ